MQARNEASVSTAGLKDKIDKSELPCIIKYKGQVYEIQYTRLRNLGVDHREPIEQRVEEFGGINYFFSAACSLCEYNRHNLLDKAFQTKGIVIAEDASKLEQTCTYKPIAGVQIAGVFTNEKKGITIYAEKIPCAFDEALVSYLADNGYLKEFELDREYNFKSISFFEYGVEDPKNFEIKPEKHKWLKRFLKLIRLKRK